MEYYTEDWQRETAERRLKEIMNGNVKWLDLLKRIFPIQIPEICRWTTNTDICEVLNIISQYENTSHMFIPRGGGMDLLGADFAGENGCIELLHGNTTIVKPSSLTFHAVGDDPQWYYFSFETLQLKPSGIYEKLDSNYEELTEISPGEYEDRSVWEFGYGGIEPLPETARLVIRELKGSFVIFGKYSAYNLAGSSDDAYDGRHNRMSEEQFKEYIKRRIIQYKTEE